MIELKRDASVRRYLVAWLSAQGIDPGTVDFGQPIYVDSTGPDGPQVTYQALAYDDTMTQLPDVPASAPQVTLLPQMIVLSYGGPDGAQHPADTQPMDGTL